MSEQPSGPRRGWLVAVPVAAALAGMLFVASAVSSAGVDLRPAGADLRTVVADRARDVERLTVRVDEVQADVERLGADVDDEAVRDLHRQVSAVEEAAGFTAVTGPGVVVTLDDAPSEAIPDGVDANLLVVHQQDIQAFVNALWSGGAVAMTLQGRRLVSTTAVKCVGNTVVIEGVPYSPPYVIEAVGDTAAFGSALDDSAGVGFYREDAEEYGLGIDVAPSPRLELPAFAGLPTMEHAQPL